MDQTLIERSGYTVLDILSDVGGLQGILISAISFILSVLNHNQLGSYLASQLFTSKAVTLMTTQSEMIKEFCLGKCTPQKLVWCQMEVHLAWNLICNKGLKKAREAT